ncbi:MAG: hypothetical protein EOO40_11185 [Deltaproteobacteria bacterium]|nr:MAG: hypothetical protein EOO40_11185 [Deltaproteobacteria bacterium]
MRTDPATFAMHAVDARLSTAPSEDKDPAVAFEALFVGEIFKAMRATVHESDSNFGQSVFTGMLDEQLAQDIAEAGGLGLTSALQDELGEKHLKL